MNAMNENNHPQSYRTSTPDELNRRGFFAKLCVGLSGLCAALLGVPLVGFVIAPLFRKTPSDWISVGKTNDFEIGKTVNVPFPDPSPLPWAGITAKGAAWLRREPAPQLTAPATT